MLHYGDGVLKAMVSFGFWPSVVFVLGPYSLVFFSFQFAEFTDY